MTNDARPPRTEIEAMAAPLEEVAVFADIDAEGERRVRNAIALLRTLASAAPVPPEASAWLDRTIEKYRLAPEGAHARAIRDALGGQASAPLPASGDVGRAPQRPTRDEILAVLHRQRKSAESAEMCARWMSELFSALAVQASRFEGRPDGCPLSLRVEMSPFVKDAITVGDLRALSAEAEAGAQAMKLTDEMVGAAMLAIAHANNMDYSIRLTKIVVDECTYTLTVADGSEPMEFASYDEASTELRRRLLRAQAIGALEAALSATSPTSADAAREVAALVGGADAVTIEREVARRNGDHK